MNIWVWRSLVACLNGVQEAGSSNLLTQTKKQLIVNMGCFFLYLSRYSIMHIRPLQPSFTMRSMVLCSFCCTFSGILLTFDAMPSLAIS